jgi:hypothetical protein
VPKNYFYCKMVTFNLSKSKNTQIVGLLLFCTQVEPLLKFYGKFDQRFHADANKLISLNQA